MNQELKKVDEATAVEFLRTTLAEMIGAGLKVAVKNVDAKDGRPHGIIIFCGNVQLAEGELVFAGVPQKEDTTP